MLVYDIIRNCDITQVIHIYLADWADEDDILMAFKSYDEDGKITIGASSMKT